MTDFFGGILDNLRSVGNDVNGFFGGALGNAVEHGIAGGIEQPNSYSKLYEANRLAEMDTSSLSSVSNSASPYQEGYRPVNDRAGFKPATDFNTVEQQWIRRIQRFAELDSSTSPKVNEKGP